jgi:hypothetical protein
VVMPTRDHDCMGFFADQVKLTHALVRDLDEVVQEVKLLGEHGEDASQKITEIEALYKKLREDTQKLKEENTKLERMVESCDELITEIAMEIGLERMGEGAKAKDEDDDDGGDTATPPALAPPTAAAPEEIVVDEDPVEAVPEQEARMAHEVILANAEPKLLQPYLYHMLIRDYEESPSMMMDNLDNLDDPTEAYSDVDELFPKDGSNDRD